MKTKTSSKNAKKTWFVDVIAANGPSMSFERELSARTWARKLEVMGLTVRVEAR